MARWAWIVAAALAVLAAVRGIGDLMGFWAFTPAAGSPPSEFILEENGSFLLMEDGYKIGKET